MTSRGRNPRLFNDDGSPRPPYARKDRREKFQTILAAEDVEIYTHIRARDTDVFPKRERGGLALKMENEATDAYSLLSEANDLDLRVESERAERLELQRRALTKLKLLNHHIEYLHSPPMRISNDVFEYWTALVDSCRNQAAAWYLSDKERAAKAERRDRSTAIGQLARAIGDAIAKALGATRGPRQGQAN